MKWTKWEANLMALIKNSLSREKNHSLINPENGKNTKKANASR